MVSWYNELLRKRNTEFIEEMEDKECDAGYCEPIE